MPTYDARTLLKRARFALGARALDIAATALRDYARWRANGGAEPQDGDAIADDLGEWLASEREQQRQRRTG